MKKNTAYNKSIKREISSSKARFISIMAIIFLGVAFYAGIKSSGPDLENSISDYFNERGLMDSKIVSSLGLNENDLKLLQNNDKIEDYYATKSVDVNMTNTKNVVKFMEYTPNSTMNKLQIVDGKFPENSGEIALDEQALKDNPSLKIGDTYTIKSDKDTENYFKKKSFKIVGFVQSPMHIDFLSRGTTSVGKGSIDYFAVINKKDLDLDAYTEIYVRFENTSNLSAYSAEYKETMEKNTEYLEDLYSKRQVERIEEVKADAGKEIYDGYQKIKDGEDELEKAQKELDDGKEQIKNGKEDYQDGIVKLNQEIEDGKQKISDGEKELKNAQNQIDSKKSELKQGEKELAKGKQKLDSAKQNFLSQGIDPTKSTTQYQNQINGLDTMISTYKSLSNDIDKTVKNTKRGEAIPADKIQYWKAMISDSQLGLSDLSGSINSLEKNPKDTQIATNISTNIKARTSELNKNKKQLQILVSGITEYQQGVKEYEKNKKTLLQGKVQLEEAQKEINKNKKKLEESKIQLANGEKEGKQKLVSAKQKLENSEKEIIKGQQEIDKNKKKLEDNKKKLKDAEEELDKNLEGSKYYFFDREDNSGYSTYKGSIESLDKIASVFPVFFFLVAALICLTTMTRMVEENRTEIGTLKALGYRDYEIAKKFIVYAMLATIAGSVLGIIVGCGILPKIISDAYGSAFMLPDVEMKLYPSYIIQSVLCSLVCTVGASLFVLKQELQEQPSALMRVKAPKVGKKILLERITPIWKRLNFNQKVTFRNLFRYKQRMLMTIIGISGCTAILIAGLGLQHSNNTVNDIQFGKLMKYDAIVVFNENSTSKDDKEYQKCLNNLSEYKSSINVYQDSVTFSKKGMSKQTATMYVPQNPSELPNYMLLNDRVTGEKYSLDDRGAVINEKLATLLGAKVGDNVVLTDSENNDYTIKISHIVENYSGHYVYLSPAYYNKVFNQKVKYNAQLLNFNKNVKDEDKVAEKIMANKKVTNVTLGSKIRSMSESADLGMIMVVIIGASGSLAFVVLYNLININISERIREISTIKVLGFYDNEVDMYIFRENIILTLLGILTGCVLGKLLYSFLITMAELDNMMLIPTVNIMTYINAGIITMVFAICVMFIMHIRLKNINMIDALKSVE